LWTQDTERRLEAAENRLRELDDIKRAAGADRKTSPRRGGTSPGRGSPSRTSPRRGSVRLNVPASVDRRYPPLASADHELNVEMGDLIDWDAKGRIQWEM